MAAAFGFSVGDFLGALNLVKTITDALLDSGEATNRFRELIVELRSLETALIAVRSIEFSDDLYSEGAALQAVICACRQTIDGFYHDVINKYQPHLAQGSRETSIKGAWAKVRWAVCKQEDAQRFKEDIRGQAKAITMLLVAIHIKTTCAQTSSLRMLMGSFGSKLESASNTILPAIQAIRDGIDSVLRTTTNLKYIATVILRSNAQIVQLVLGLQRTLDSISNQVQSQQGVYIVDALGRHGTFDLSFIRSSEALLSVLRSNFTTAGGMSDVIARGFFVIENAVTKRPVDLSQNWDMCFRPGQRYTISVVFLSDKTDHDLCPRCKMPSAFDTYTDVQCQHCGMTVRLTSRIYVLPPNSGMNKQKGKFGALPYQEVDRQTERQLRIQMIGGRFLKITLQCMRRHGAPQSRAPLVLGERPRRCLGLQQELILAADSPASNSRVPVYRSASTHAFGFL